jgi:hypothetical protein
MADDTSSQPEVAEPEILPIPRPPIGHQLDCAVDRTSIDVTGGQSVHMTAWVTATVGPIPSLAFTNLPKGVTASATLVETSTPTSNPTTRLYEHDVTISSDANTTAPSNTRVTLTAVQAPLTGTGRSYISSVNVTLNAIAYGQLSLSHVVLNLVYAPPGTNGGKASSSAAYSSGSSAGTTLDLSQSVKNENDFNVSLTLAFGGPFGSISIGGSLEYDTTATTSDESKLTITKSQTKELDILGPSTDGIDHDQDVFYLLLNPVLMFTVDAQGNMKWMLGYSAPAMDVQYVYVSWLKNPSLMEQEASQVYQSLQKAGVTTDMFAEILALNPFANGGTAIDPARFQLVTEFPYEGPTSPTNPVQVNSITFTSVSQSENTQKGDASYKVAVGVDASIQLGSVAAGPSLKAELKDTNSMTVDVTTAQTETTSRTQTIKTAIGGPAYGWAGPTHARVYLDTLFNSFMFALTDT